MADGPKSTTHHVIRVLSSLACGASYIVALMFLTLALVDGPGDQEGLLAIVIGTLTAPVVVAGALYLFRFTVGRIIIYICAVPGVVMGLVTVYFALFVFWQWLDIQ